MKYTEIAGKKLSAMSLGTVQLGMNYGIANTNGQPEEKQSFEMLSTALANGITSIDTARAYGTSENVLGKFFKQYKGDLPFITTKIIGIEGLPANEIEKKAFEVAETSLQTLGVDTVDRSGDQRAAQDRNVLSLNCLVIRDQSDLTALYGQVLNVKSVILNVQPQAAVAAKRQTSSDLDTVGIHAVKLFISLAVRPGNALQVAFSNQLNGQVVCGVDQRVFHFAE